MPPGSSLITEPKFVNLLNQERLALFLDFLQIQAVFWLASSVWGFPEGLTEVSSVLLVFNLDFSRVMAHLGDAASLEAAKGHSINALVVLVLAFLFSLYVLRKRCHRRAVVIGDDSVCKN